MKPIKIKDEIIGYVEQQAKCEERERIRKVLKNEYRKYEAIDNEAFDKMVDIVCDMELKNDC